MEQVTTCLCVSMCVRESHSESEREGVEGVSLSSQAQGRPCQGVAQRRGRVPSHRARLAHSVRVLLTLWVFLLRVAALSCSGK